MWHCQIFCCECEWCSLGNAIYGMDETTAGDLHQRPFGRHLVRSLFYHLWTECLHGSCCNMFCNYYIVIAKCSYFVGCFLCCLGLACLRETFADWFLSYVFVVLELIYDLYKAQDSEDLGTVFMLVCYKLILGFCSGCRSWRLINRLIVKMD